MEELLRKLKDTQSDLDDYADEKSKYYEVLKVVKKLGGSIKSQKCFSQCYSALFNANAPTQGTISSNFRAYRIEKNENGNYARFAEVQDKDITHAYIIKSNCTSTLKTKSFIVQNTEDEQSYMYFFSIITTIGSETIVCNSLHEIYGKNIFMLIPGYGSVGVLCSNEKVASNIKKYVRRNLPRNANDNQDD